MGAFRGSAILLEDQTGDSKHERGGRLLSDEKHARGAGLMRRWYRITLER